MQITILDILKDLTSVPIGGQISDNEITIIIDVIVIHFHRKHIGMLLQDSYLHFSPQKKWNIIGQVWQNIV